MNGEWVVSAIMFFVVAFSREWMARKTFFKTIIIFSNKQIEKERNQTSTE